MTYATLTVEGQYVVYPGVPTLEQMQVFVRGLVEVVGLNLDIDMWINEEGKYEDPRINPLATALAHNSRSISPIDWIAGNVLFTGGADDDGETIGLTKPQLDYLNKNLKRG